MRVPALAATTTATGTPSTAAAAGTTAAGARRLRIRDLDGDAAPIELPPVELRNRVLGLLGRGHLHEPEATRLPRETIGDHGGGLHVSGLREELTKPFARGRIGETADIEF
jgi:hypothetical protein